MSSKLVGCISFARNIKMTAANRFTVAAVKLSALWLPSK